MSAKKVEASQRTAFLIKKLQSVGPKYLTTENHREWGRKCLNLRLGRCVRMEQERGTVEFGKEQSQMVNEIIKNSEIQFPSLLQFVIFY